MLSYSQVSIVMVLAIATVTQARQNPVVNFAVNNNNCEVVFKDCGSVAGKPISVSINGTCTGQGFAVLKRGTSVMIDFQFQAFNSETSLRSVVHGKISDLPWVPFPLGNPDACKNSGLSCPVPANKTVNYTPVLSVLKSYPAISVIVKWELQNSKNADVFCIVLPAVITD